MGQIFSRGADTWLKVVLLTIVSIVPLWLAILLFYGQEPGDTGSHQGFTLEQPVPFSHKHHVGELGLDCRYCHASVETESSAGYPPTQTCMTCHSQIWTDAPMLEPLRESLASGKPIKWQRVHDLPDFVYFHHGVHIQAGVSCTQCHGDVTTMPLTRKDKALTMAFCLDCHRDPQRRLVPENEVFNPHQGATEKELGAMLAEQNVQSPEELEACNACHR